MGANIYIYIYVYIYRYIYIYIYIYTYIHAIIPIDVYSYMYLQKHIKGLIIAGSAADNPRFFQAQRCQDGLKVPPSATMMCRTYLDPKG